MCSDFEYSIANPENETWQLNAEGFKTDTVDKQLSTDQLSFCSHVVRQGKSHYTCFYDGRS